MIDHGPYNGGDAWRLALSDLRALAYAAIVHAGAHGDEVIAAVAESVRVARSRGLETEREHTGRHRWRPAPQPRGRLLL